MNERTHFFIKIYLSHFILERVDVGCVWEVSWRRGQTVILTQSSSDHSSTSFSSWLGCSTVGHGGPKPSVCRWFSRGHLVSNSNWLKPSVSWLYFCLTPTCFRCSYAYLHKCISWLTARSRFNMLHIYISKTIQVRWERRARWTHEWLSSMIPDTWTCQC